MQDMNSTGASKKNNKKKKVIYNHAVQERKKIGK
jgi:hypothetical protein